MFNGFFSSFLNSVTNSVIFTAQIYSEFLVTTCPEYDGKLRVIACIDEPLLIAKNLEHVQKRTALASRTARGPPAHGGKALNLA